MTPRRSQTQFTGGLRGLGQLLLAVVASLAAWPVAAVESGGFLPQPPGPAPWFLGEALVLDQMAKQLQDAATNGRTITADQMRGILARDRVAGEVCERMTKQWLPRVYEVSSTTGNFLNTCSRPIFHCPWLASTDIVNHTSLRQYPNWAKDLRDGANAMRIWANCISQAGSVFVDAQRNAKAKQEDEQRRKADEERKKQDEARKQDELRKKQDLEAKQRHDDEVRRQQAQARQAQEDAARADATKASHGADRQAQRPRCGGKCQVGGASAGRCGAIQ